MFQITKHLTNMLPPYFQYDCRHDSGTKNVEGVGPAGCENEYINKQ